MAANVKINRALLPLAWIYGAGVWIRNQLFDRKILPVEEFSISVISIGNLAVGGTGKTPHTEYLIRLLSKKYKVAVLSRGYRRKTKGFVLADENASSQILGDEPFQMFRKFPHIWVAVDSDRRRGIRNLLNLSEKPEVILLDDAFQHRWVKPSLSILLSDFRRPFDKDELLPAGRLREPAKNAARADIVISTCHSALGAESPVYGIAGQACNDKQILQTSFRYKSLLPLFPEKSTVQKESIERLKKEAYSFLLVAGLARPQDMVEYIEKYTTDLHSIIYPDHHPFARKDIDTITDTFNHIQNKNKRIITSEKDAVRLIGNPYLSEEIKPFLYYLPIEVVFRPEQETIFTQKIEDHVRNFKRNRILA
ncbi:tetraacyldisaccharide 4'-kinase [Bacteroidia bacterium]|nr:tetraacyldisaccharide 4'-kinase [Bacteroidia bacterium]